jgi:hypothetical protein
VALMIVSYEVSEFRDLLSSSLLATITSQT